MQYHSLLSLLLVAALAAGGARAADSPRPLHCPNSIVKDVHDYCTDHGTVLAGRNVTYVFNMDEYADLDMVVTLQPKTGDADLVVNSPDGLEYTSMHGGGEDQVFISRDYVYGAAGEYIITVVGYTEQSDYTIMVETFEKTRTLAAPDRAALQELLDGPCCARAGSCPTLRKSLETQPTADLVGKTVCYDGITLCDASGRLVQLSLVNQYLSCPFPAALGKLTSLAALDLNYNSITGSLDQDVAPVVKQLPGLQNLVLANNRLVGSLSCDLVAPKLAELDITGNQVAGTIPSCLLSSPAVRELYLSGNPLTGQLPALPATSNLLILSASNMDLSGPIPDVSGLPQLVALQLANNQLTGALPVMPASVRNIYLEGNRLSGSIPEAWGTLGDMEVLRLRGNQLSGPIPAGLATLPKLKTMLVSDNQLTGQLPSSWDAPILGRVEVQNNKIGGPLPADLVGLPMLTVLNAASNQLTGTLDSFAGGAAADGSKGMLKDVLLSGNGFTGSVPEGLKNLALFKGGFIVLDDIVSAATLDLSSNKLNGPFPDWVVNALANTSASVLLGGNQLTCPPAIYFPMPIPPSHLKGLTCLASDGSTQEVGPLVTDSLPSPAVPQAPAAAAEPAADGTATADSSQGGQQQEEDGAGVPTWAIVLSSVAAVLVVLAVVVSVFLCCRKKNTQQYDGYQGDTEMPDAKGKLGLATLDSLTAADKVAAKGSAAAVEAEARSAESFRIGTRVAEQV